MLHALLIERDPTHNEGRKNMCSIGIVLLIMLAAGVGGAAADTALADPAVTPEKRTWRGFGWTVVASVAATFLVPLFLKITNSNILEHVMGSNPTPLDYFLFGAFCLLAATSARRFIGAVSERYLKDVQDLKTKTQALKSETQDLKAETRGLKMEANEVKKSAEEAKVSCLNASLLSAAANDAVNYGTVRIGQQTSSGTEEAREIKSFDPNKGRFNTNEPRNEANGRKLTAKITNIGDRPGWCAVRLDVVSTTDVALIGSVTFHLHPTFNNSKPIVPVIDGRAVLTFTSWGAFTVGAETDGGNVKLELDLAEHEDAKRLAEESRRKGEQPWNER